MRSVAMSEAKDHLSEMVAAAEAGQEIVITRHGKPAAKLVAVQPAEGERRKRAQAAFDQLADIRAQQRSLGMTSTIEEMIAWKNEGRR